MVVIKSHNSSNLLNLVKNRDIFVDFICKNGGSHSINNEPLVVFIKIKNDTELYVLNSNHGDCESSNVNIVSVVDVLVKVSKHTFVIDKKKFLHVFKNKNVNDLLICLFQEGINDISSMEFETNYHNYIKYKNFNERSDVNFIIPLSKHIERFNLISNYFEQYITDFSSDESYKQLNGIISETLAGVESNGLSVMYCSK